MVRLMAGKYAVVVGGGSPNGIGFAAAQELDRRGFSVIVVDKHISADVASNFSCWEAQVDREFAVANFWENIVGMDYDVRCLVNSAGINIPGKLEDYPWSSFSTTLDVNVKIPFLMCREYVQTFVGAGGPRKVINIGSDAAKDPKSLSFAYCASKAALTMLTRCFARDFAKTEFSFYQLDPSYVGGTNMDLSINNNAAALQQTTPDIIEAYRMSKLPIGRAAIPCEIAEWVGFLSECGNYATGTCISIGGGS